MCKPSDVNSRLEIVPDEVRPIGHIFFFGDAYEAANELMMQLDDKVYYATDIEDVKPFAEELPTMNMHYILADFHIKEDDRTKVATTNTCMFAARWENVRENIH